MPRTSIRSHLHRRLKIETLERRDLLSTFAETVGKAPLTFEPNLGQTDDQVDFLSRGSGYTLFLTPGEAVLTLKASSDENSDTQADAGAVLRAHLAGADPNARALPMDRVPGISNYLIGNDSSQWVTDVPHYSKVAYEEVYPGIDLLYYGTDQRRLEYDFVVAPGGDPGAITLDFAGAQEIIVDADGNLVLRTDGGDVVQEAPLSYQEMDGARAIIPSRFVLDGDAVGFQHGPYDTTRPLVIDPVLSYSTYLGGTGSDPGAAIDVDSQGNIYIGGFTTSRDFPAAQSANAGGAWDGFVAKLDPSDSTLVYSTYIGGSGWDQIRGIHVDAGNIYASGQTTSPDFPTTSGAFQESHAREHDGFAVKLNAAGNELLYSTFVGGRNRDIVYHSAIDSWGNFYLTGGTESDDFPTSSGAYQSSYRGGRDAFVAKLNASGSELAYSSYLGRQRI